jgi:hypothetical protein
LFLWVWATRALQYFSHDYSSLCRVSINHVIRATCCSHKVKPDMCKGMAPSTARENPPNPPNRTLFRSPSTSAFSGAVELVTTNTLDPSTSCIHHGASTERTLTTSVYGADV